MSSTKANDTLKDFFRHGGAILGDRGALAQAAALAAMAAVGSVVATADAQGSEWRDTTSYTLMIAEAEQRLADAGIDNVFVLDRSRDPALEGTRLASVVGAEYRHAGPIGPTTDLYVNRAGETVCVAMGANPHASAGELLASSGIHSGNFILDNEAVQHWMLYRAIGYCLAGDELREARADAFAGAMALADDLDANLLPVMTVAAERRELTGRADRFVSFALRRLLDEASAPGFHIAPNVRYDIGAIAASVRRAVVETPDVAAENAHLAAFGNAYRRAGLTGASRDQLVQFSDIPEIRQVVIIDNWLQEGWGGYVPDRLEAEPSATADAVARLAGTGQPAMLSMAADLGVRAVAPAPVQPAVYVDVRDQGAAIGMEAGGMSFSMQAGPDGVSLTMGDLFGLDPDHEQSGIDISALFTR